jgi:tetratricopeptide (TPR) repeat protein
VLSEFDEYLRLALQDIDQAIELSNGQNGDYFRLRSFIYDTIASNTEPRDTYQGLQVLALENLQRAVDIGTRDPTAYRDLVTAMVGAGECEQGLAEAQRQLNAIERGDSPSAGIQTSLANAYICLGRYPEALSHITTAIAIWDTERTRLDRAVILYALGRKQEALDVMDGLIHAQPYFSGGRYFFRALIYYDLGHPDLASQDLETGYQNTWGTTGIAALVRGLMARDAGDRETAVEEMQIAEETLKAIERPFLDRARQELASLGVEPEAAGPQETRLGTPMPTLTPYPEGGTAVATPPASLTSFDSGTAGMHLTPNGYLTYRFVASIWKPIDHIKWLKVAIHDPTGPGVEELKIYLWKPSENLWIMYSHEGDIYNIPNPERFVLPHGEVFISLYAAGDEVRLEGLDLSMEVLLTDGTSLTPGPRPTPAP